MAKRKFDYTNKSVVITGGAGGIGRTLALKVAEQGAHVTVVDIRKELADGVAAGLPGPNHRGYGCDLTDRGETEALVQHLADTRGRIDVLVNNMGMTSAERFDSRPLESIERELTVNLYAPLMLTRLAIPLLQSSADPRVISTVSLGGIFPLGETPIYTASKFGLRGAMLSIGLDLRERGITAGSVLPSATDTRMLRQEALDGGNSLQFQDPPQSPEHVAQAMMRLLDKPRLEVYPRLSESWLVRIAMLSPNQLPRLMPLFRGRGDRGQAKYIRQLRERGLVEERDGELVLTTDT